MGRIVRITRDGLLSIAGMLIEDPALDRARIDSVGNLYVRMLIEDPTLTKIDWEDWGQNGIIKCRMFWEGLGEGSLWSPAQKFLYLSHQATTYKLLKINTADLSVVTQLDLGTVGIIGKWKDGNYFYGPAVGATRALAIVQIKPLSFIRTISLGSDPYGTTSFTSLYLDSSYYHVLTNTNYINRYRRNDNIYEKSSSRFQYTEIWLYYYDGFLFSIGPDNNNRLMIGKSNYISNYSLYYDYTQTLFAYPKWADLAGGYIYIISAYSIIKINCGSSGPMSLALRITHNLNLVLKESTAKGGAFLLARDYIYVIYTNTSYNHYIRIYNPNDLSVINTIQFGSGPIGDYVFLATDDEKYIYILTIKRTIYKIKKDTLEVIKTVSLSSYFLVDPPRWQNNFIIAEG